MNKKIWIFPVRYIICIGSGILTNIIWTVIIKQNWLIGFLIAVVVCFLIWVLEAIGVKLYNRYFSSNYPEIHSMYQTQLDSNHDMNELLLEATKLEILTIRGLGILGLNDSALRKSLNKTGGRIIDIKVFMLSPDSKYVDERAKETNESPDAFKQALELGINRVKELKVSTAHNIKIYKYDHKPCWRIIRIDDTFFVSVFDGQIEGHQANVYRIDGSQNGTLGKALKRYLESVQEQAIEI